MTEPLFTIQETPITLVNLLTFVGVIILSFLIAKGIARATRKSSASFYGLSRLAYYAIFLIGFYIALTIIGIDLTGVAVVVGALSVGVGFGLQAIFNNFVAGIIVLLEKKIHPGDFIDLQTGEYGEVVEINVRTTVMKTMEGQKVVIPNTDIIAKKVIIGGKLHRMVIPFSVARDVEKDRVRELATTVSKKDRSEVWLTKVNDQSAQYDLVIWGSQKKSIAPYIWDLEESFGKANIKISIA